MKKIILILCVLLVSCTSNDEMTDVLLDSEITQTNLRSESEAIDLAIALMDGRSNSRSSYVVADVDIIGSESSRASRDTLIYAVSFADNKGFVLVSAAKAGEDILGYADEGTFALDGIDSKSGLSFYMEAARDYVRTMVEIDTMKVTITPNPSRPVTTYEKIPLRVTVEWGQEYPEGIYCDNGLSGCVQTAMAQMMTYFKQPVSINLTYPEKPKHEMTLDWNELEKHNKSVPEAESTSHNFICEAEEEIHKTIGLLCRELGYRNNAVYINNPRVTTSTAASARYTFVNILPSDIDVTPVYALSDYGSSKFFDLLYSKNGVALMGGLQSQYSSIGHAWICCGGERITTVTKGVLIDGVDEITVRTYFYYNWGNNGKNNAYFSNGVFDDSKGIDMPPSRANYSYNVHFFYVNK